MSKDEKPSSNNEQEKVIIDASKIQYVSYVYDPGNIKLLHKICKYESTYHKQWMF